MVKIDLRIPKLTTEFKNKSNQKIVTLLYISQNYEFFD